MNIGIAYHGVYPHNRGIQQLAGGLVSLGHKTCVFSGRTSQGTGLVRQCSVPVISLEEHGAVGNIVFRLLPAFNPCWSSFLVKQGRAMGIRALILRESMLGFQGIRAGKRLGIPVYLDMRENMAAMYQAHGKGGVWSNFLKNPTFVRAFERRILPAFNGILVVSPELREWLLKTYGVNPRKVKVFENYPSESYIAGAEAAAESRSPTGDAIRLVFAGYVSENRGLGEVIQSLPIVARKWQKVKLVIIGEGKDIPRLKALVEKCDVADRVEFVPMLPQEELAEKLADCHVGLLPYWVNEQSNQTVPGKLFEYMAAGLPFVTSPRKPVIRIVQESKCGVVYDTQTPGSIAAALDGVLSDPDEMRNMGSRARKMVHDRYNWRSNLSTLNWLLTP